MSAVGALDSRSNITAVASVISCGANQSGAMASMGAKAIKPMSIPKQIARLVALFTSLSPTQETS